MTLLEKLIASLRDWIAWDKRVVADREAGPLRDFDLSNGARLDVTDKTVREAKARIVKNEALLNEAEAKNNA
jgi:hypothetical protein